MELCSKRYQPGTTQVPYTCKWRSFKLIPFFSVPKIIPMNTPETRKPFFPIRIFRTPYFWFFFGKILWRRNKFQLTNYLFYVEINYEIKGVRFDQMKISGRGTEPKKTEMMYLQQSIRKNFISSTWLKVRKRSPVRLGKLIFFTKKPQKLKIAKIYFSKIVFEKNEKFHSVSRIVPKIRKLATYRRNTKRKVFPSKLGKDESKRSFLRTS